MKIDHSSNILSLLKSSLNDYTLNDVKFLIGEKNEFYASSLLLASHSPVFKAMLFTSGLREQQTKQIELKDVNSNIFLSFLEYLTTGEIELNIQNGYDIFELSDKYRIEKLYLACKEILKKEIKLENCFSMIEKSIQLNIKETEEECWKIIDKETAKCLNDENNLSITDNFMNLLLARETLNCREIELFRFLVKWGKKQSPFSFKDVIKPFLHHIRFPLMNFKELIREVRPLGVIDDSRYIEALEFNGDIELFYGQGLIRNKLQFQVRKGCDPNQISSKKFIKLNDSFIPYKDYSLSQNNTLVLCADSSTCLSSIMVDKGIHKWSLRIIKKTFDGSSFMCIGIAPYHISQSNRELNTGWFLSCNIGNLYSGPPMNYSRVKYGESDIPEGSIIDVELNISAKTIKYFINGVDKGVAYQGIPTNQPLRLAIRLSYKNSIEFLSHKELEE